MALWKCDIDGCDAGFEGAEAALRHQVIDHEHHGCQVCGTAVPEGYFAIRHAFTQHTRADYVRAYNAGATAVRTRERVMEEVESAVDVDRIAEQLGVGTDADRSAAGRDVG